MGKSDILKCDCGCGVTSEKIGLVGWLELKMPIQSGANSLEPKLRGELYFSSFECNATWSIKAASALPGLQAAASGLSPRGSFSADDVAGLYV